MTTSGVIVRQASATTTGELTADSAPPGQDRDLVVDLSQAAAGDPTQVGVLADYLGAVRDELDRDRIGVRLAQLPQQALTGSLTLDVSPTGPDRGGGSVPLAWQEEIGWSPRLDAGTRASFRRWLPHMFVPDPAAVAEFALGTTTGQDLGRAYPAQFRYRLAGGQQRLITQLARFASPCRVDPTTAAASTTTTAPP